uniref:Uncharacterized protein n=1 Tax=Anopheles stephensi TaxID=30069 RepID=A0A182YF25_ANOST
MNVTSSNGRKSGKKENESQKIGHLGTMKNNQTQQPGNPPWLLKCAEAYNTKLALLALPSVIFEPRFRGSVRNLVYSDQPGVSPRRQEMRQPRDIKVV